MKTEYPTDKELKKIKNWDITKKPVTELLNYVRSLWWHPDMGFRLTGKRVLRLELHTLGWSGNEDIIVSLQENLLFWAMCWQRSIRGGHYWFKLKLASLGGIK